MIGNFIGMDFAFVLGVQVKSQLFIAVVAQFIETSFRSEFYSHKYLHASFSENILDLKPQTLNSIFNFPLRSLKTHSALLSLFLLFNQDFHTFILRKLHLKLCSIESFPLTLLDLAQVIS